MDEIQENSVENEVATQEVQQHEQEATQQQVQDTQTAEESRQERNWRAMRQRQEALERELRKKDELLERFITSQIPQKAQEVDELDEIPDEEYVPKAKTKKLVHKETAYLKKEIEDLKKEINNQKQYQFMNDLKRQYSDFDDVVNQQTLALLEEKEPELAQTIAEMKDPYKVGVSTYKYIKALNLTEKVQDSRRLKEVEKKLDKNAKTVQSPLAYEKRPLAQAYVMTESDKSKLYEEMMNCARQAGSGY